MAKTISINLNNASTIDNAIKELREYQAQLKTKTQLFTERLADVGIRVAYEHIQGDTSRYGTHKMEHYITFSKVNVETGKVMLMGVGQEFMSTYKDSNGETHIEVVKPLSMLEFGSGKFAISQAEALDRFGVVAGQGSMSTQGHEEDADWGANNNWSAITPTMPMFSAWEEMYRSIRSVAKEVWK